MCPLKEQQPEGTQKEIKLNFFKEGLSIFKAIS